MINYSLKCDNGHSFDSWFKSSGAYDALVASGMVQCAVCGSANVEKAVMAPRVSVSEDRPVLSDPTSEADKAIAALREKIEAEADYVGSSFVRDVRAMNDGDIPERPIYGEASLPEAKSLIEDGVEIAPLPFVPKSKAN